LAPGALEGAAVTRVRARKSSQPHADQRGAAREVRGIEAPTRRALTLHLRSVALESNVQDLLDWLVDEELERWQREER
jgi:hypothetical protein